MGLRPGEVIAGRYRLLRVVRSGGVSVVYRAEDVRTGDPRALKVIHVAQTGSDLRRRIEREIEVLEVLDHPHIVRCHDAGALDGDRMYLALDWLEGVDVADYRLRQPVTLRQALELLTQAGDALEASHEAGIVHRDVKPANLFLVRPEAGRRLDVRVIDYGVAKLPESAASLTRAGAILGTPSYMAPEQASQAMDADARADVFSLGVVAYELVAGRLPWQSTTDLARLAHILSEAALPLDEIAPGVPDAVTNLVHGMLEIELDARIETAAAVRDIAKSCLEVLAPSELDQVYVDDPEALAALVRAETMDLPDTPAAEVPQAPSRARASRRPAASSSTGAAEARRHSTPTSALDLETDERPEYPPLEPAAPSVRFRSVVRGTVDLSEVDDGPGTDDVGADAEEPHEDTQELEAPGRAAVDPSDDLEPAPEATELRPAPSSPPVLPEDSAAEVLDAITSDGPAITSPPLLSPLSYVDHVPTEMLYGRVAGLERLERRVTQPLSMSRPTLTVVIGPAGIGKTRVRTELAKGVAARRDPPRVFAGRAEESFRTTPFAFVRRLLFTESRVRPDDDDAARRAKVLQLVPGPAAVRPLLRALERDDFSDEVQGPTSEARTAFISPTLVAQMSGGGDETDADAEEDRAVIAAFLCEALRVPYPDIPPVVAARHEPSLLGHQMRRAMDVVLRALATESGLVVLVDDAHLLDRQSAEILRGLTDPRLPAAVAVVAFALPTLLDVDAREPAGLLGADPHGWETVELGPLEPRASREMARHLAGGPVRGEALERLVQRAAGNPLSLEQTVRAVQASGALSEGPDGELALPATESEAIPPTVAAAVSARLSLLSPRLQRVLTAAAVFGEIFWAEGVAALVARDVEEVLEDLDRLLVSHFVRRRSLSRYHDQTELEFTHAVVRSVALSRLKRTRRRDFEGRAARYLERVGEADQALVARHVAHSSAPGPAAERFAAAAREALALGDPASAGILVEEGLRVAESAGEPAARIALFGLLERVALARADWETGRDVMDTLSDLLETDEERARLFLRRSRFACMARRYEEARVEAQEAEAAFRDLSDDVGVASAQLAFAEASESLGDGRGALRGYLAAQVGLGSGGASDALAKSARGLARIAVSSGDYSNAENRFRSALVASRTARDYPGILDAELGLGEVRAAMGEGMEAKAYLEEALRVAFDRGQRLRVRVAQARLLFEEERPDDAFARLDRIHAACEEAAAAAPRRVAALGMGQAFRRRAGRDDALRARRDELDRAADRLARARAEAITEDPALLTALQLASAVVEALRGARDRSLDLVETAQARFQAEGALAYDEPPAVFYTVARVTQITGGGLGEVKSWLRRAVAQLDAIGGRLERKQRNRYLDRPLCRAILEDAGAVGLAVDRDVASSRLTAE